MTTILLAAAAIVALLSSLAIAALIDNRHNHDLDLGLRLGADIPPMCGQCAAPTGTPAGTVPGGWTVFFCVDHQLVVGLCSDGCEHAYIARHDTLYHPHKEATP